MLARIGGAFGHGDRSAHLHAGVDGVERRKPAQRVAADVAEYTGVVVFADHFGQCRVHVAVAAALAQGGRTRHDDLAGGMGLVGFQSEGAAHAVGGELARAGQFTRHAAADGQRGLQNAAELLLDERLPLLDDQQRVALRSQPADFGARQRVLCDLEHGVRASVGIVLHQVVVGDAAGDDAPRAVGPVAEGVEAAGGSLLLEAGILLEQRVVAHARVARHEYPLAHAFGGGAGVGVRFAGRGRLDDGARVGHARGQAHQYGDVEALRVVEGVAHHVVGLLLGGGLEDRDEGEFAVEARVLFVLRRVHRRVVGRDDHQAAVGSGHARIDKGVGGDVHADVLHADQRPFAAERHAEGLFHGGLLVGRPFAVDVSLGSERVVLDVFRDFGGGGAGIGVDARQTGMEGAQCEGFISEQKFSIGHRVAVFSDFTNIVFFNRKSEFCIELLPFEQNAGKIVVWRVCLAEKCKVPKMKAGNSPERGISRRAEIGTGRTGVFGRASGRRGLTCRLCGQYLCGRPACRSGAGICRTRCIGRHRSPAVHGPSARWAPAGQSFTSGQAWFWGQSPGSIVRAITVRGGSPGSVVRERSSAACRLPSAGCLRSG